MALLLCPACARHVRESESACPFCGAHRVATASEEPALESSVRLSRAALVLAGALAAAACDRRGVDTRIAQPYGAPPTPPTPDVVLAQPVEPDAALPSDPADAQSASSASPALRPAVAAPNARSPGRSPSLAGGYGAPPHRDDPL